MVTSSCMRSVSPTFPVGEIMKMSRCIFSTVISPITRTGRRAKPSTNIWFSEKCAYDRPRSSATGPLPRRSPPLLTSDGVMLGGSPLRASLAWSGSSDPETSAFDCAAKTKTAKRIMAMHEVSVLPIHPPDVQQDVVKSIYLFLEDATPGQNLLKLFRSC